MAVPFNIPDEEEASEGSSVTSTTPNTPSRPIPIPQNHNESQQLPHQISSIDNEVLVQAFYEALCRCSQAGSPGQFSQTSPHFWFPSPSTSNASSPRSSFRSVPRRRLNSYGSHSQFSYQSDDEWNDFDQQNRQREQMNEFHGQIPMRTNPEKNKKKSKESHNKITGFVISALQFVIDSLR